MIGEERAKTGFKSFLTNEKRELNAMTWNRTRVFSATTRDNDHYTIMATDGRWPLLVFVWYSLQKNVLVWRYIVG